MEYIKGWLVVNSESRIRAKEVTYYRVYVKGPDTNSVKYKTEISIYVNEKEHGYHTKFDTKAEAEADKLESLDFFDEVFGIKENLKSKKKNKTETIASEIL